MSLTPTPGQTVGPFFGYALPFPEDQHLVPPGSPGAVRLQGTVYDGRGEPVPDAILELWQADASGAVVQQPGSLRRDGWTFTGWGRASTDALGHYSFTTVAPAAPFFAVTVFARGLLDRLFTRAYLPAAADDPFLATLDPDRRSTLVVTEPQPGGGYVFDVYLQGERETVFLSYPRH
ncbi:MAG TPA: protocatechuate 3,4-dioxygenase subunit alpha [Nocardioides sp.]|uniref:protocatechuate 3,4-dioxygenase subunit alpha n=1 Tax=uncultured Nocardioides sp. TaxID=198441 RepID=UPI00262C288D|nr:protocatechuate 3,4-dioxygenase subunit alpha [uncultured Nocardioides sp.]HRD61231.1 protocatechuate 3,4-dioxygenase subunit alpha [Nocardioides sp.]HRI96212.1 protocatechuate 3,4-dioxygenase subunit alpha [Nocardioides sp.]